MSEPGTLENVALILGRALAPLAEELQPGRALVLLNKLGLGLPASAISPQLSSAIGAGATAAGQLPALVTDLVGAIEVGAGGIQIGIKSAPLVAKVVTIIDSVTTIANQLRATTVPGLSPTELTAFAQALPGRLLDYLLTSYLEREQPTFAALLSLFGVIRSTTINPGSTDPKRPEIEVKSLDLGRLGDFFSSPDQLALELYGWGQAGFNAPLLLDRLYQLLSGLGLPVARSSTPPPDPRPSIEFLIANLAGTAPGINPPGLEVTIRLGLGDGFELSFPIAPGLELEITAEGGVTASTGVLIQPPANLSLVPPSGSVQGTLTAGIAKVPGPGERVVTLFGVAGGTGLSATRLSVGLTTSFAWNPVTGQATGDFGVAGRIEGGKLVISLSGADGFLRSLMSGFGIEADFDLGFGWSAGQGVYFTGSGGLEVQVPSHIHLGPVEITALTFRIGITPAGFPVTLSADVKGALGPVRATVEGIGATATLTFPDGHSGNLGPVDLAFAFKAPTGVGLAIDAGIIAGGGFLRIDADRGEYAGALELEFAEFLALSAIGLITTRNPDGSPGFSLLIVITAEFPGGIQLGYGFTLLAVGGLLGVNRSMNLAALMEGVRSGAVESVMFPRDVVANAPRILSDLRAFFPARPGTFLVGPMLKLGWGTPTLVSVAVGVIIEIPGNIAIVGVLKVVLPTEEAALLRLQVNFAGAIEFDKKRLYFFAALYESRILFMTIEGELGLLVAWGDDPNFVLSAGGFHPRFDPPPLPFPSPRRIVVSILDTDWARIRVTNYFAVTSNTVQFGASAQLYFGFSAISIEGHIGFDALFQISPFHFIVEISAGVSLKVFGAGVFGINLHFTLEGTSPWRARGTGSISFLFFEVSADFDVTWGEPKDTQLEPADVLPLLGDELDKDISWHVQLPPGAALPLSLRDESVPADRLVLHPIGALQVRQRAVPLDLVIAKVGSREARDANRFTLSVTGAAFVKRGEVTERFAMAQYLDLDDAAKLSRPAFEPQHGGIELVPAGSTPGSSRTVRRVVRYEEVVIDNRFRRRRFRFQPLAAGLFDHFLGGASVARSPMSQAQRLLRDPHDDAIAMVEPGYVVASRVDNTDLAGTTFTSQAAAMDHLTALSAANPNLGAHVIPSYEAGAW